MTRGSSTMVAWIAPSHWRTRPALEQGDPHMRRLQMVGTGGVVIALLGALAAPAAAQETVPIEGTLIGDHWIDESAPACDLPDTSWRFYNNGAGQLSGLGEVELFTTHCTIFDPESGGVDSTYYHRTTMFTTADGDTLAVVHQIPSTEVFLDDAGNFTGFTLKGTWEAVGGTGRFTHAAGSGTIEGTADIPGDIVLDLTGEVTLGRPEPPME
jgi:hypothetical protein